MAQINSVQDKATAFVLGTIQTRLKPVFVLDSVQFWTKLAEYHQKRAYLTTEPLRAALNPEVTWSAYTEFNVPAIYAIFTT